MSDNVQFCPEPQCLIEAWLVSRDEHIDGLWLVESRTQLRAVVVSAELPVCPDCGTTLVRADELDASSSAPVPTGPAFAFIQRLG